MLRVAVDGPAGSGKSTVSKILSRKFDLLYIDTGAMYRACAYLSLENQLSGKALVKRIAESKIILRREGTQDKVYLDFSGSRQDISETIRTPEVTALVSTVAAVPEVRELMTARQQEIASEGDVIMDGRDIGSVVIPDAEIKIFLTASNEERARRRYDEWKQKDDSISYDDVLADMLKRDADDMNRETAPLVKAADALEVDTSGLDIDGVVAKIAKIIQAYKG